MNLCELVGGFAAESAVNTGSSGRTSALVTVKTLRIDADEQARLDHLC